MIKRTIEISGPDTRLSMRLGQIIVQRDGAEPASVPAEDVGLLIVDTATANYTHGAMIELAEKGALAILCGENHHPAALVIPVEGNSLQTQRIQQQAEAPLPLRKQLWRQIVAAKISNQAAIIEDGNAQGKLQAMAERVRSGDPENMEAQAARLYWQSWLADEEFHRGREGKPPNNFLNYGYMAIRACVARAICGAGLHPALGLNHSNRFNAFCLADDLMEPFRPLVDLRVRELYRTGSRDVDKSSKTQLLNLLTHPCSLKGHTGPLMVAVERLAASLCRCYAGEQKKLDIPIIELENLEF